MKQQKLSQFEVTLLQEWVVAHGETWHAYLDFCEKYQIGPEKRFTPAYYKTWVQRRRSVVQGGREKERELIRRGSVLTRELRLRSLEEAFSRLERRIAAEEGEMPPDVLVRLLEQQRKTLEAISKERGEFGVRPPTPEEEENHAVNKAIAQQYLEHFAGPKT